MGIKGNKYDIPDMPACAQSGLSGTRRDRQAGLRALQLGDVVISSYKLHTFTTNGRRA